MVERHKIIPASYLVLLKDRKVLLMRRANTGFMDGHYSLIAGHVDSQEPFSTAIIREAYEEAGIRLKRDTIEVVHVMSRRSRVNGEERVDVYFQAKDWEGEPKNCEPSKCDDLAWFDIDNLPTKTIPYVKDVIDRIIRREFYSEDGWQTD